MTTTRTLTRASVAVAAALTLVAGAGLPASASTKFMSKDSGEFASVQWTEYGAIPNVGGNVHTGFLDARSGKRSLEAFGFVEDWDCDPGESPYGGGHGEEGGCDFVSFREFYGDESQLTLTVDRKLNSATLSGTLSAFDPHDGPTDGGPTGVGPGVDITWTGVGSAYSSKYSESFTADGVRYRSRYSDTNREATVSGQIGTMGFADDADDEAYGSIGTFTSRTRVIER